MNHILQHTHFDAGTARRLEALDYRTSLHRRWGTYRLMRPTCGFAVEEVLTIGPALPGWEFVSQHRAFCYDGFVGWMEFVAAKDRWVASNPPNEDGPNEFFLRPPGETVRRRVLIAAAERTEKPMIVNRNLYHATIVDETVAQRLRALGHILECKHGYASCCSPYSFKYAGGFSEEEALRIGPELPLWEFVGTEGAFRYLPGPRHWEEFDTSDGSWLGVSGHRPRGRELFLRPPGELKLARQEKHEAFSAVGHSVHAPIPWDQLQEPPKALGVTGYEVDGHFVLNDALLDADAAIRLGRALPLWELRSPISSKRYHPNEGWQRYRHDKAQWVTECKPLGSFWRLKAPGAAEAQQPPKQEEPAPVSVSASERQEGGDHYKGFPIQPAHYNIINDLPWAEGEVTKYVARWRRKGGVLDLKKARHILDMLIEFHEGRLDYDKFVARLQGAQAKS